jgi:transposase
VEETQLGPHDGCQAAHSPSGWTTVDTFRQYLEWLRGFYGDSDPIHLILDAYSVHRSQDTRNIARELNIELHFIPPGWTDELQPLDRYIFGAMKSICRRLFQRFCLRSEDGHVKTRDAIQFLIQAWEGLETRVIEKGWGLYEDVFGEADDEDEDARDEWEPGVDHDRIE